MEQVPTRGDLKHPLKNLPLIKSYVFEPQFESIGQQRLPALKEIVTHINNNVFEWDIYTHKNKDFKFPLPNSVFENNGQNRPIIEFREQNFDVERLQLRALSTMQLRDIKYQGTFQVDSEKFDIPYKWKITHWIMLGFSNIKVVAQYHLAHCNGNIRNIFGRIYNGTNYRIDIYKGLKSCLYKILKNTFSFLLGKRLLHRVDVRQKFLNDYQTHMVNQFSKRHQDRPLQIFFAEKTKEDYKNTQQKKNVHIFEEIRNQLNILNDQESKKFLEGLSDQAKQEFFIEKIKENKQIPENVKQDMFNVLRAMKIMDDHQNLFDKAMLFCPVNENALNTVTGQVRNKTRQKKIGPQYSDIFINQFPNDKFYESFKKLNNQEQEEVYKEALAKREAIEKGIRQRYPILGKHSGFKKKKLLEAFQKEYDFEMQKKHSNIKRQLGKEGLKFQQDMYDSYLQFYSKQEEKEKQYIKENKDPYYTFNVLRRYANPKEVIKSENNGNTFYYLKTSDSYEVKSDRWGWKLKYWGLFFKTSFLSFVDQLRFTFKNVLKKIFTYKPFLTKYQVNSETGELKLDPRSEVKPLLYQFVQSCRNISQDRARYENAPDDQFFGKKFGRILNVTKNYIFKFFFKSILYNLIIKPVFTIAYFSLVSASIILSPFIILGTTAISFTFTALIYDFLNYDCLDYPCLLSVPMILFQGILGLGQAVLSVLMIVLDIVAFALHFVLFLIRPLLLSLYNSFTYYCMLKPFGRVPVSENSIAYRIAGPGVGKMKYFYSLSQADLLLLVRAKMEEIELKRYQDYVKEQIEKPRIEAFNLIDQHIRKPLKQFLRSDITDLQSHYQKEQILKEILSKQINKRIKKFPQISQVQNKERIRFKKEELEKNLQASMEIVQEYISKDIEQDKIKQITKATWVQIFNNPDIVDPLDQFAWQFQLLQEVGDSTEYTQTLKKNIERELQHNTLSMNDLDYYYNTTTTNANYRRGNLKKRKGAINYAFQQQQDMYNYNINLKYCDYNQFLGTLQKETWELCSIEGQFYFFINHQKQILLEKQKEGQRN